MHTKVPKTTEKKKVSEGRRGARGRKCMMSGTKRMIRVTTDGPIVYLAQLSKSDGILPRRSVLPVHSVSLGCMLDQHRLKRCFAINITVK